jgi:tryptophanyl-tRNA synthetase
MACDILMYDANIVPVGKDQRQHLEMTRDIASTMNHQYGDVFVLPDAQISEQVMTVPGLDGQKMSKSYGNIIDIFQPDKKLRKNVMQIVTDSKGLEEPKDPDSDNVFALYSLLASEDQIAEMRQNYEGGNYGYGHAKQALYELIVEKYAKEREAYNYYMENLDELNAKLEQGEEKARLVAREVLTRVKSAIGF